MFSIKKVHAQKLEGTLKHIASLFENRVHGVPQIPIDLEIVPDIVVSYLKSRGYEVIDNVIIIGDGTVKLFYISDNFDHTMIPTIEQVRAQDEKFALEYINKSLKNLPLEEYSFHINANLVTEKMQKIIVDSGFEYRDGLITVPKF